MKNFHCLVKKAFDNYDNPGCIAVLSEGGYARMSNGKFRDHVEVLAVEHDNGDVYDAAGKLALPNAVRVAQGNTRIDPFAIAEAAKGAGGDAALDREEKKSRTR